MHKSCILAVAVALLASPGLAFSAPKKLSARSGIFTDEQATQGGTVYQDNCAMCHGPALEGNGEAPPLVGRFIPDWQGTSLADLWDKIHDTMPLFAPGSLSAENTSAILAFILKSNGFPAGSKVLTAREGLKWISLTRPNTWR